jgi:hypothetical protein
MLDVEEVPVCDSNEPNTEESKDVSTHAVYSLGAALHRFNNGQ